MKPGSLARESHSTQVVERNEFWALVVHALTSFAINDCYDYDADDDDHDDGDDDDYY